MPLVLVDESAGATPDERRRAFEGIPVGNRFFIRTASGKVLPMRKVSPTESHGILQPEEPANASRETTAGNVAASAIRAAGGVGGAALGLRRGNPFLGAAMGSASVEPIARMAESYLSGRPVEGATPMQVATAGFAGSTGAVAPAANPFLRGAVQGGTANFVIEAGDQIERGRFDPMALALNTAAGAVTGGALDKSLNVASLKLAAKAEKPRTVLKAADPVPQVAKPGDIVESPDGTKLVATDAISTAGQTAQKAQKERGVIATIKDNPETADPLRSAIEGYYTAKPNADTLGKVSQLIDTEGLDRARIQFGTNREATPENNALGAELIKRYRDAGNVEAAADVARDLAERATTQGQAIQILATLSHLDADGALVYASKVKGSRLSNDEVGRINALKAKVDAASTAETKLARQAEMLEEMNGMGPAVGIGKKLRGASNLAMLLNPKTLVRNLGGNVVMQAAEVSADGLAVPVDVAVSIFTGKRTIFGPQIKERAKGLLQPYEDFMAGYADAVNRGEATWPAIREGIDTVATLARLSAGGKTEVMDISRAYRATFSNPVAKAAEKTLSVLMGAPDRAFYVSEFRASLANQLAAAKAAGDDIVTPTPDMVGVASMDSARAIFQDTNFASRSLNRLRKALNEASTFGRSEDFGAGQALIPFSQVPGSILLRGAEYSPLGFVRSLYEVGRRISGREFNQKEFAESFARATLGTGALVGNGYVMGKLGLITAAPDKDKDISALQRSSGWGAYGINVSALKRRLLGMDFDPDSELGKAQNGDIITSYDWLQPVAMPVAIGAQIALEQDRKAAKGNIGADDIGASVLAGLKTFESQPLLQGLARFSKDTAAYGVIAATVGSVGNLPAQMVPSLVSGINGAIDQDVREIRGTTEFETSYNAVVSRVPYLAQSIGFPASYDTLGKKRQRFPNAVGPVWFNTLVNPAFITELKRSPQAAEVLSIYDETGRTEQAPRVVEQNITITRDGRQIPVVLNGQQLSDYQRFVGRLSNDVFAQLVNSPDFMAKSNEDRAKLMAGIVTDVNTAAKILMFGHRPKTLGNNVAILAGIAQTRPELRNTVNVPELGGTLPKRREQ